MTEPENHIGKLDEVAAKIAQVRKAVTAFVLSAIGVVTAIEVFGESQGWGTTGLTSGVVAVATALGVYVAKNDQ